MKKNAIYKWIITIVFFVITLLITKDSKAASISVTTSKSSVMPGENFTVTVSVSGGAGMVNVSATNATLSKTSLELMLQSSATINCTAGASGTISINANGTIADYTTEEDAKLSAPTTTVSIVQNTNNSEDNNESNNSNNSGNSNTGTTNNPTTNNPTPTNPSTTSTAQKSSNANLSNLGIRPNDFSGFRPGTTTYNVTVPNDVESVEVYATKADSKATVTGTGTKTLQEGANALAVTVTAEDGTTKTYTINVTRESATESEDENATDENMIAEENQEEVGDGLAELTINNVTLSPSFETGVYEYTAKYIGEDTKFEIEATPTDETYIVDITGNEDLQEGENIITILVSDAEGNNVATYQITVDKSLVDEEAIAREQAEKENQQRMIIIGVVVAVVIIGIIIFIIIKRRRNKQWTEEYSGVPFAGLNSEDEDTEEFDSEEYDEQEEYSNQPYFQDNYANEDNVEDDDEEWPRKKKHGRGKRFK